MPREHASAIRICKRDGRWFVHCRIHKHLHHELTFPEAIGWTGRHWAVWHYQRTAVPLTDDATAGAPRPSSYVRLDVPLLPAGA